MTLPLCQKMRGTKQPLEGEREQWIIWLKTQPSKNENHGIRSHYLWQINEETMEIMTDFIS